MPKHQTDPDVRLLQAAADPTRLSILRQLSEEPTVCACDFSACCDVAQPTVSHHLKVLREAGWVSTDRRGTWIYYTLRPEAVARFQELAGGLKAGEGIAAAALGGSIRLRGAALAHSANGAGDGVGHHAGTAAGAAPTDA